MRTIHDDETSESEVDPAKVRARIAWLIAAIDQVDLLLAIAEICHEYAEVGWCF